MKFCQNYEIWSTFWNLVEILKFNWNCEIWSKFWNLIKLLKFGQNSENSRFGIGCMVWFGFEGSKFQHSQSVSQCPIWSITKVGIELLGQLKSKLSKTRSMKKISLMYRIQCQPESALYSSMNDIELVSTEKVAHWNFFKTLDLCWLINGFHVLHVHKIRFSYGTF